MGSVVLDMSMSLDGFIAGPDDGPEHGLGVDGGGLHAWLANGDGSDPRTFRPDGPSAEVFDEMLAAGDNNVMMHAADAAQACLRAGVLDEMQPHLVPVLLGAGRRLFDHLGTAHTDLELTRIIDAPGGTHLRYRVLR